MIYCLDIETTTDFKTIRMVGLKEQGGKFFCITDSPTLRFYIDRIPNNSVIYTWNGSAFDFPMIEKLWGVDLVSVFKERDIKHADGYILSKLVFNDRKSHSLENYAQEYFGEGKLEVDYDKCSLALLSTYCEVDCILTTKVIERLKREISKLGVGSSFKTPLQLEQHVARLIKEQGMHGFRFDVSSALVLAKKVEIAMEHLEREAEEWLPTMPLPPSAVKHPPKIQFKKDGTLSSAITRYIEGHCGGKLLRFVSERGELIWVAEVNDEHHELPIKEPLITERKLTLSNQTDLKKYLLEQGWKPTIWNTKKVAGRTIETSPRLTDPVSKEPCPNLTKILSPEKSDLITRWLTCRSRKNILRSDKGTGLVYKTSDGIAGLYETGIIHHSADTLGTPTGRFIHRDIVNIPRVGSVLGKEVRSLFIPREGMVMVGWDASSLEACMEAHYVYPFDSDYADEIMDGDIHTKNQLALGLPDRATAKTFKYAITYGAQPARLASSLSVPLNTAKEWYDSFWKNNEGLRKLKAAIEKDWESKGKKYITGLDGRWLLTRSQHSLLNTKLQGGGAIVMKYALVIAHKRITELYPEAKALIRYHDEEQWECPLDIAEEVGKIGVQSITDAAQVLGLNVPLTGEYKVGNSWAETH